MARIKNIKPTPENNCACGTWFKHWDKFSGQVFNFCLEERCTERDADCVHAQLADSDDETWYLVPLCKVHGKSEGELTISDAYGLVTAEAKEACEKQKVYGQVPKASKPRVEGQIQWYS